MPSFLLNLSRPLQVDLNLMLCSSFFIFFGTALYVIMSKPRSIYLVDYACFKPPPSCRAPSTTFIEHYRLMLTDKPKIIEFQRKIIERSGLGEETSLPDAFCYIPPQATLVDAMEEAELVIVSLMDSLFERTGLKPNDIDILIVNCSLFSSIPSLSTIVINKYKLRDDVKIFNLSGMGCSGGLISVDLARHLLQVHRNSNAVIISMEILTRDPYKGNERSMHLPSCLFRMGGVAILLSNQNSHHRQAKYRLLHIIRSHRGAGDDAYQCVYQQEDSEGNLGVKLSKNLMTVAGEGLKANITALGPLVLPLSEQLLFFLNLIPRKFFILKAKPYIPNFKQAFEHFCIHAGGSAVIDGVQKNLHLSVEDVEASRMTLHRFGNTSSSSTWYQLNYIESKGRMKRGDRTWQIAFGSGYKCVTAVWVCNRSLSTPIEGPWSDCIHRYPVDIPEVRKL